jgi:hypothetical protein
MGVNRCMKTKSYMRYHRYDTNNVKHIKRFELNEVVPTTPEPGYSAWTRGTGPHNPDALNNVQNGVRKACLGIPKTPEQKHKMSIAKLGVPKTEEHKLSMRKSWERRRQLLQESNDHDPRNSQTV